MFSNALAPPIVGATLEVLNILELSCGLQDALRLNTLRFRKGLKGAGFTVNGDEISPICPIIIGEAHIAR